MLHESLQHSSQLEALWKLPWLEVCLSGLSCWTAVVPACPKGLFA
jgi:hypothetical protein